jgi:hypothetical protein
MIPKHFKESNSVLAKPDALTDSECESLSVFTNGRECISLWKPSLKERISILFFGNVWLSIHSGTTQPPVWIDAKKTIFIKPKNRK